MEGKIEDGAAVMMKGQTSYRQIHIGDALYKLGDVVILEGEDATDVSNNDGEQEEEPVPNFAMIQYIGEDKQGDADLQVCKTPLPLQG